MITQQQFIEAYGNFWKCLPAAQNSRELKDNMGLAYLEYVQKSETLQLETLKKAFQWLLTNWKASWIEPMPEVGTLRRAIYAVCTEETNRMNEQKIQENTTLGPGYHEMLVGLHEWEPNRFPHPGKYEDWRKKREKEMEESQ